ncbi:MAG: hypothetical protein NTU54_02545, partial [Candidatus Omnitrophica bacterium]|nr:hypothetical protein [Candidatus Omnitrophota bacterium]
FSIMDFHQPCLARLIKGEIRLSVSGSRFAAGTGHRAPKTERFFIKNGIARVVDNRLTLLVEK